MVSGFFGVRESQIRRILDSGKWREYIILGWRNFAKTYIIYEVWREFLRCGIFGRRKNGGRLEVNGKFYNIIFIAIADFSSF